MVKPWWKQLDSIMQTCSYSWTHPSAKYGKEYDNDTDYEFFDKKIVLSNAFIYDAWVSNMIHVDNLLERAEKHIPFLVNDESIDFSLSMPELGLEPGDFSQKYWPGTRLTYIKMSAFTYGKTKPNPVRLLEEFYIESPRFIYANQVDDALPHKAFLPPRKRRKQ